MRSARKTKEDQINLLPQEEFAASATGRILHWLLSTFRYLVITTEMVVIAAFISRFYFDSKNADLNDEIKQKEEYITAYSSFEEEYRQLQDKLAVIKTLDSVNPMSKYVEGIVSKLPRDMRLVKITTQDDGGLIITGESLSEQSIQQLVVNLATDETFSEVALQQVDAKSNTAFLNFSVRVNLTKKE